MGAFFVGWLLLIVVITFQKINQMDIMAFKCAKKVKSIVLLNNNSKRNTSAHLFIILSILQLHGVFIQCIPVNM